MKRFFLFALVATMFAACVTDETQDVAVELAPDTLTVSFEGDDSRIQLQNGKTVWTQGDLVSVFYRSNANQKWQYQGSTGERTGNLKRVNAGNATETTSKVVVVYPYNERYYINPETCDVEAFLPAQQTFLKDSYGLDGNIMISSGYYNQFSLKNVCGWLKVQLTGNGDKVKSIKLKGNNGEQVAGQIYINSATAEATLASEMGGADDTENGAGGNIVFDDTILTEVTLDCGEGLTLSAEPTAFYIGLPPQTFAQGLTIEITACDDAIMTKSTSNSITIERNAIQPMAVVEFGGGSVTPPSESSTKIATIEEQSANIKATITTINAIKASIETTISSLQEQQPTTRGSNDNNGVKGMIAALEERIAALENIISNLERYTENDLAQMQDWATATFATMEMFNTLATELATLKATIAEFDGISTSELTAAISTSEQSMKGWVNERLSGYYTIAEVDAQIATAMATLTEDNASMREELESLIASLSALKSDIEIAYKEAITSAINDYAGVVNEQIAAAITSANEYIKNELSTINSRLDDIEQRLDKIEEAIKDLVNRIQSISYIKKYGNDKTPVVVSNGKATVELDFEIAPKNAIEDLVLNYKGCVKVQALYSNGSTSFVNMPITSFTADVNNGIITVIASGENLSNEFYNDQQAATLRLEISDGNNDKRSEYINIKPQCWYANSIIDTPAADELYYISTDNKIITPYRSNSFDSTIINNYYDFNKGHHVIKFADKVSEIGANAFFNISRLKNIAIPNSVVSVNEKAFAGCSNLTSISLSNNVTTIGNSAFRDCKNLTNINIEEGLVSIGEYAFANCSSIYSITIPSSVTEIGNSAFVGCLSLKRVDINDLSTWCKITFDDYYANPLCNRVKLYLNGSELTDITIPSDITEIKGFAFVYCDNLISITIPDSITSIGDDAFNYCNNLVRVTIGNGVTEIGERVFLGCSSLTNISIPDSVISIEEGAFADCSSLTNIHIPGSVISIGLAAFSDCSSLASVTIGNSVTSIGNAAFEYCTSLTSITIPDSVTSIGDSAFAYCTSLTSITIPENVISIGDSVFYGCTGALDINSKQIVETDYTSPGNWLSGAEFTTLTICSSVSKIGDYAFAELRNLSKISIKGKITSIGKSAFESCVNLISFTIPISVTEIGSRAFFNCRSLTNITFVNGGKITLIKEETFCDCESLTKIAIPKTVTEIEYRAFFGCRSLSSVTIPDNVTKMGEAVFYNCSELKTVNIGEGITAIQDFAFDGCGNLTNVRIGSNVASIGRNAFYSCTKLTSVYCKPVTPPSIYYWFGENAEGDTFFYGSFPMSQELKIYVPMSSYDAYISPQNGDDWDYSELSVKNWTAYASNIVPYNF